MALEDVVRGSGNKKATASSQHPQLGLHDTLPDPLIFGVVFACLDQEMEAIGAGSSKQVWAGNANRG